MSAAVAEVAPRAQDASTAAHRPNALLLIACVVFALALAPRWVARDTYVTADEDNWMRRAGGFAWGLANGRPGRTFQNGHPGVLTMELAVIGQGPGGAERFADPVTGNPRVVTAVPDFFEGLVDARRAFALATSAFVGVATFLFGRLFGASAALLGGIVLALDPFYLAHSQLVHLDALLAACMTVAVLCGVLRWSGGGRGWVVAGGAFSGLALLAKSPAAYLAIAIPLLALTLAGRRRSTLVDLALWGVSGLLAFVLFWPSMWVNSISTLERMIAFARETGGQPHEQGSYFLGRAVADPGPLFYPVAVALRLGVATTIGLLTLLFIAWREPRSLAGRWRLVLALLGVAAGFDLFMTLGAKKFDRYLLPIFPTLSLLAGLGFATFASRLSRSVAGSRLAGSAGVSPAAGVRAPDPPRALSLSSSTAAPMLVVAALALLPLAVIYPHYLAYYNPLLGGGATAARLIPVGEGEGLKEAAAWLNAQPGADNLSVVSHSFDALKANLRGGGETLRDRVPSGADYVVIYVYQSQIEHGSQVLADYAARRPEHVVHLGGIDYVRIYRGPHRPVGS